MKALLWFVLGTTAFWAAATWAASRLWPDAPAFAWSTAAALLCAAPDALTLAWTTRAGHARPQQQLVAVLGGTTLRMVVVLAGALVLFLAVPGFEYQRFWLLVVVYYLFTLSLEMLLIVRGTSARPAPAKNERGVAG